MEKQQITAEELANLLNGRNIGEEINKKEGALAKENNLVVIFGASDDLMELRGAIDDEVGGEALFRKGDLYEAECEDESCPHEDLIRERCKKVEAVWNDTGEAIWTYKTSIPHHTFDILEDDGIYCRGIVFNLKDIQWKN